MAANTRFATGVHTLVILAAEPAAFFTSNMIAERLKTNPVVVRRVLSRLQQAGLIDSHKGPSGGSKLARPPKSILLGEVYRALEASALFHVSSAQDEKLNASLDKILSGAQRALEQELNGTTVSQLVKKLAKGKK